jgi:hypothetical protein
MMQPKSNHLEETINFFVNDISWFLCSMVFAHSCCVTFGFLGTHRMGSFKTTVADFSLQSYIYDLSHRCTRGRGGLDLSSMWECQLCF